MISGPSFGQMHLHLKFVTHLAAVIVFPQLITGCVLPPVATAVSLSLDGASLAASDKTIVDHTFSHVLTRSHTFSHLTRSDCAFARTAAGGKWCADPRDRKPNWQEIQASILLRARYGLGEADVPSSDTYETSSRRVEFIADPWGRRIARLDGFAESTSLFGIIGEHGALEVYAHEVQDPNSGGGLTLVFTLPGYADWPNLFVGVVLHGTLYATEDIIV